MSALGQKQTCYPTLSEVRFVPEADICGHHVFLEMRICARPDFLRQSASQVSTRLTCSTARYELTAPKAARQPPKPLEHAMRSKEHLASWDLFQRAVTLLLVACVVLLAVFTTLTWIYLAAISREIAVATSNHSESVRALLAALGDRERYNSAALLCGRPSVPVTPGYTASESCLCAASRPTRGLAGNCSTVAC
jgi:hypothetical protein